MNTRVYALLYQSDAPEHSWDSTATVEAEQTGLDAPSRKHATFRQSVSPIAICRSLNFPVTALT